MEGNVNLANLRPIKPSLVIPPGGVIYFDLTWGVPGSATPFATANVAQIVLAGHKR